LLTSVKDYKVGSGRKECWVQWEDTSIVLLLQEQWIDQLFLSTRYAHATQGAHVEAAAAAPPPPRAASPDQFRGQARLPRFATPRRYDFRLRPDLVASTFSGSAAVAVAVSAPTRFLVLNAADLSVDRASIRFRVSTLRLKPYRQEKGFAFLCDAPRARVSHLPLLQDLAPKDVTFFADDEILVLQFAKDLPLGEGVLSMNFNGTLNDKMRGFYAR
jgi:hypothetical protein